MATSIARRAFLVGACAAMSASAKTSELRTVGFTVGNRVRCYTFMLRPGMRPKLVSRQTVDKTAAIGVRPVAVGWADL